MDDYIKNLGKNPIRCVYQIKYKNLTKNAMYIGSTNDLKHRIRHHLFCSYNKNKHYDCKVYQAIRELGQENFIIDLLYIGENEKEVEAHLIRVLKPSLNIVFPGRTKSEYYQDNIEDVKQSKLTWRYLKSDVIKKKDRERYEDRKEYCNKKSTKYYWDNKARLSAVQSTPCVCVCGKTVTHGHKSQHRKSHDHKNRLAFLREELVEARNIILRL